MTFLLYKEQNNDEKSIYIFCCLCKTSLEFDYVYISQIYKIVQIVSKSLVHR